MPRNVQKDPESSLAWTIKDEVVRRGRVYYGKLRGSRSIFVARRLVPYFNALAGSYRARGARTRTTTKRARDHERARRRREDPTIRADLREGWTWLNSDNRRRLSLNDFIGGGRNGDGASWFEVAPGITYRPLPALTFNPAIRYSKNIFDAQWVGQITDASNHYVFAHLDQTTVAVTLRLNYTVSPTLSLQLYAQPFVSAGSYDRFKELANGRSLDYAGRYRPYSYDLAVNGDPDFNVKSFRTTNVVRWEYKPGSTLFVVWQQARENQAVPGGFRFGRDVHDIFGVPPNNVFLVKLAYWLNFSGLGIGG